MQLFVAIAAVAVFASSVLVCSYEYNGIIEDYNSKKPETVDTTNWTTVDDQDPLISYNKDGVPFLLCTLGGRTSATNLVCELKKPYNGKGIACYSTWISGALVPRAGCLIEPLSELKIACSPFKCHGRTLRSGRNFCCCFGHECNRDFIEPISINTTVPDSN